MKVNKLLSLFACLLAFTTIANSQVIDSLKKVLNQETNLYKKGLNSIRLLELYANISNDTAFQYGYNAIKYANDGIANDKTNIEYYDLKGQALFNIGALNHKTSNFDQAKTSYLDAISFLKKGKNDKLRAKTISYLARIYEREGKSDLFLSKTLESLSIQEKLNDSSGMAFSHICIGDYYARLNKFDTCLIHYNTSLNLLRKCNDLRGLSFCLQNLGSMYKSRSEYSIAINLFFEALAIQEKRNDKAGMIFTLVNIGSIHKSMGELESALKYYNKAEQINKQVNDQTITAKLLFNKGDIQAIRNKPYEAIKLYSEGLAIMKKIKIGPNVIANCLNDLSKEYHKIGKNDTALNLVNEALALGNKISFPNDQAARHINKANILLAQSHISDAEKQIQSAFTIANKSKLMSVLKDVYLLKSKIEEKKGNPLLAIDYLKKHQILNDSLNLSSAEKRLLEKETANQISKSNQRNEINLKKIELLKKEKQFRNSLMTGFAVLLLLAAFGGWQLFRNFKQKKNAKEQEVVNELNLSNKEIGILRERINTLLIEETYSSENLEIDSDLNQFLDEPLSEREMDVLKELSKGNSNKLISETLFISVNTVRTHLLNIYAKLDVGNRTQAVKKAGNLKLLS